MSTLLARRLQRLRTCGSAGGPVAAGLALATACALAGCAGVPGGRPSREGIQRRYDLLGEAVARGDLETVSALAPGDSLGPAASLTAARTPSRSGGTRVAWVGRLHRFRIVGDTAVVDVTVRVRETPPREAGARARVTTAVVRGFWVSAGRAWILARTEPLGGAETSLEPD